MKRSIRWGPGLLAAVLSCFGAALAAHAALPSGWCPPQSGDSTDPISCGRRAPGITADGEVFSSIGCLACGYTGSGMLCAIVYEPAGASCSLSTDGVCIQSGVCTFVRP